MENVYILAFLVNGDGTRMAIGFVTPITITHRSAQ
jgi:hypothetical protein